MTKLATFSRPYRIATGLDSSNSGEGEGEGSSDTRVLRRLSMFLRDEFVPLIQLTANTTLREVQLDGSPFTAPVSSADKEDLKASLGTGMCTDVLRIAPEMKLPKAISKYIIKVRNQSIGIGARSEIGHTSGQALQFPHLLTAAAAKCYLATRPLLNYWLQLPLHATMLVTVFERLIQGFVSSAKEEVERLTYGWQSSKKTNMPRHYWHKLGRHFLQVISSECFCQRWCIVS